MHYYTKSDKICRIMCAGVLFDAALAYALEPCRKELLPYIVINDDGKVPELMD